jgi:hypothetical protein
MRMSKLSDSYKAIAIEYLMYFGKAHAHQTDRLRRYVVKNPPFLPEDVPDYQEAMARMLDVQLSAINAYQGLLDEQSSARNTYQRWFEGFGLPIRMPEYLGRSDDMPENLREKIRKAFMLD